MTISALCFFNVANRSTFSQIFKRDMHTPEALARRRAIVIDTVCATSAPAAAPKTWPAD